MSGPAYKDYHFIHHKRGDVDIAYEISDQDNAGDPQYYGFLNSSGGYIIMEQNIASGTYRYAIGDSLYSTAWAARAALVYTTYDDIHEVSP